MNETRVFADGYRGVFQKQEEFLECLKSIGRNSFWERRNSRNLRLVAITSGSKVEEELKEKYADEGLDEGIITDTIINTGLLLKVRNQYYPVRSCAIKSILDRAGISGAGLRRVEKDGEGNRHPVSTGYTAAGRLSCRRRDHRISAGQGQPGG